MSGLYVTDTGFVKPTLAELVVFYEELFQTVYGDDVDLDSKGPAGQMVGILSKKDADIWEAAQEIYTSRNPAEATGTSLDFIASENGLTRIDASPTRAENVKLYGDQGTPVAAGKQARQTEGTINYSLESAITIDIATAREVKLSPDDPAGTGGLVYSLIIDAIAYSYTTTGGDGIAEVIAGLILDITTFAGTVTNEADTYLVLDFTTTDFAVTSLVKLSLSLLASAGVFVADDDGENSLPASSLTVIVTPVSGWNLVINPDEGDIGREQETDAEFRLRRASSFLVGKATDEAIKTALLQEVDDVSGAKITSNRLLIENAEGIPAKSFESVVSGGLDQDIADKIWDVQPSGISSYGNTTIEVTDSEGEPQDVSFSRAENRYIHIRIERDFNTEEVYPANGDELIKQAIVDWASLPANIDVGVDVIRQKLNTPIYSVPGIEDIIITIDDTALPGDSPTLAEKNISINSREIASFDAGRIVVADIP